MLRHEKSWISDVAIVLKFLWNRNLGSNNYTRDEAEENVKDDVDKMSIRCTKKYFKIKPIIYELKHKFHYSSSLCYWITVNCVFIFSCNGQLLLFVALTSERLIICRIWVQWFENESLTAFWSAAPELDRLKLWFNGLDLSQLIFRLSIEETVNFWSFVARFHQIYFSLFCFNSLKNLSQHIIVF